MLLPHVFVVTFFSLVGLFFSFPSLFSSFYSPLLLSVSALPLSRLRSHSAGAQLTCSRPLPLVRALSRSLGLSFCSVALSCGFASLFQFGCV